jgi:hypothetical protein
VLVHWKRYYFFISKTIFFVVQKIPTWNKTQDENSFIKPWNSTENFRIGKHFSWNHNRAGMEIWNWWTIRVIKWYHWQALFHRRLISSLNILSQIIVTNCYWSLGQIILEILCVWKWKCSCSVDYVNKDWREEFVGVDTFSQFPSSIYI